MQPVWPKLTGYLGCPIDRTAVDEDDLIDIVRHPPQRHAVGCVPRSRAGIPPDLPRDDRYHCGGRSHETPSHRRLQTDICWICQDCSITRSNGRRDAFRPEGRICHPATGPGLSKSAFSPRFGTVSAITYSFELSNVVNALAIWSPDNPSLSGGRPA